MKVFFFATLFTVLCSEFGLAQIKFDDYFQDGAVRYDYELVGNSEEVKVIPVQTKYLSTWGGNPNYVIDDLNFGTYNFQVFSLVDGKLIYQQGFSPLFWEWQTTSEAFIRYKSFYQGLFFPRPSNDVKLVINTRGGKNEWISIFSDTIRIKNYFILEEDHCPFKIDTIYYNGSAKHNVDLVILSEGYTLTEMDKFRYDSKRLVDSMFRAEPFVQNKHEFNVFAINVPSLQSGTDIPGDSIYRNTAFNSNFYTFNSPRYLTTTDMKSVYDAIDGVGFDQIYLLVNSKKYGGGGFYNFLNVCSSDDVRSPFVFCHEFGHGFAGLGDEYYTSSTSYEEYFDKTIEPYEANLTTLVDFETKWGHLIEKDLPVPTPRDSMYLNIVGVFEGGGYETKGVYSPAMTCWMKEFKAGHFCPVCQDAIEKVIDRYTK